MSPNEVADYAKKNSRALMKVHLDDLLCELKVRALESCTLTKLDVIKKLREVADEAEIVYGESI